MKLLQGNFSSHRQAMKGSAKQPAEMVRKLTKQMEQMQDAIKSYNERDRNSLGWKRKLGLPSNCGQLKTLTEPRFQHILMESNFINIVPKENDANKSVLRNSKKKSQHRPKVSILQSQQLGIGNATSVELSQSQQHKSIKNVKNSSRQLSKKQVKLNTFHEGSKKFDQLVKQDRDNRQQKYLNRRQKCQTARLISSKIGVQIASETNTLQQHPQIGTNVLLEDWSETIIGQSGNLSTQVNEISTELNLIKSLLVADQKLVFFNNLNAYNLRRKIEQKTSRLQKEWSKTECYRQKYNIVAQQKTQSGVKSSRCVRKSQGKLAAIIQKIENRRPATSMSARRRPGSQPADGNTIRSRSKTIDLSTPRKIQKIDY